MGNCELIYRAEQDNQSELFNWEFSVSYSGYDPEQQRHFYDWMISCEGLADDGKSLETPVLCCSYPEDSARLGSGCSSEDNPESLSNMLGSLFSFLSAWAAAMEYESYSGSESENADLFPAALLPLLDAFSSDELALFGSEVEGNR